MVEKKFLKKIEYSLNLQINLIKHSFKKTNKNIIYIEIYYFIYHSLIQFNFVFFKKNNKITYKEIIIRIIINSGKISLKAMYELPTIVIK